MKIIQVHTIDDDYGDSMEISINSKNVFSMGAGEPEDMILNRDLGDAWKVIDMMKQAYEAGRKGEDFILEKKEIKG